MPRHPRYNHSRTPADSGDVSSEPLLRGRHVMMLGGALLAVSCICGVALVSCDGSERRDNITEPFGGDRPTAGASQFPDIDLPTNIPIDSESSSTPAAGASRAPQPAPTDPYQATRQAAARRATKCELTGFTNDGIVNGNNQLKVELVYQRDPASDAARAHGKNMTLTWSDPRVVLAPLKNGQPDQSHVTSYQPGGDHLPTLFTVGLPERIAAHTIYLVGVETDATTPLRNGSETTTSVLYCGGIENVGSDRDANWREPEHDVPLPGIYVADTFRQ